MTTKAVGKFISTAFHYSVRSIHGVLPVTLLAMCTVLGFGLSTGNLFNRFGTFEHSLTLLIGVETRRATAGANPHSIGWLYRIDGYPFHISLTGTCVGYHEQQNTQ